jgi:uncharacterized protein with beta-barrel porin domain
MLLPLVAALQATFPSYSHAADITITDAQTDRQNLTTSDRNITVTDTGSLSVKGSNESVRIQPTSGAVTVTNAGLIEQTGSGRAVRLNVDGNSLAVTINNATGATIQATGDDAIKLGGKNNTTSYVINNQGTIWQNNSGKEAGQALDLKDITGSTGNVLINGSVDNRDALIRADGDDALRAGSNTTITNYGTIISTSAVNTKCPDYLGAACDKAPSASDAIDLGKNTGVIINNYGTISGPRHAITADVDVVVNNYEDGQIIGRNGSGVGSDGTATVINYGLISGRYVGAGNAYDHTENKDTYTDPTLTTVNNGDGDGVDIDGIGTVTNYGRIEGLGGGGYDNGGFGNGGDGIAMGGGTVTNHAGAVIWGESNGILVDDGANGTDPNNLTSNKNRGTADATASAVTIINDGEITGSKKVAVGLVGDWDDTLINNISGVITGGEETILVDKLSTDLAQRAGAAIQMGAGNDVLENHGIIIGKNGLAIDMGEGDDTLRLFGGTVTGTIDGGTGVNTLETKGNQVFASGTLTHFQKFIVQGGYTEFNYALGQIVSAEVAQDATLKINGDFTTSNNLTVNGTLAAADSTRTITVKGDYTQGANSVLEIRYGDRIDVTGSATIASGATLKPLNYVADTADFTFLSAAGGVTADLSTLAPKSTELLHYTLTQSGNDLVLSATRNNQGILSNLDSSLQGLHNAVNAMAATGSTDNPLLTALTSIDTIAEYNQAIAHLAPTQAQTIQKTSQASTGALMSTLASRMHIARTDAASGVATGEGRSGRFWTQALGAFGKQEARTNQPGYRMRTAGLAAGWEMEHGKNSISGVSLSYAQAKTRGTAEFEGNNVDLDHYQLGLYYSNNDSKMTIDATLAASYGNYHSQRQINLSGFNATANGQFNGYGIDGRIEFGLPFAVTGTTQARLIGGAQAGYLKTGSYTETGTGSYTYHVDQQNATSLQSIIGAELINTLSTNSTLSMSARYLHEFANARDTTARFTTGGPAIVIAGDTASRDSVELGIAYRHTRASGMQLSVGYDLGLKDRQYLHQINARMAIPF